MKIILLGLILGSIAVTPVFANDIALEAVNCSLFTGYDSTTDATPVSSCSVDVEIVKGIYVGSCVLNGLNESGDMISVRIKQIGPNNDEGIRVDTKAIKISSGKIVGKSIRSFGDVDYLHAENNSYKTLSSPVTGGMTLKCSEL